MANYFIFPISQLHRQVNQSCFHTKTNQAFQRPLQLDGVTPGVPVDPMCRINRPTSTNMKNFRLGPPTRRNVSNAIQGGKGYVLHLGVKGYVLQTRQGGKCYVLKAIQ